MLVTSSDSLLFWKFMNMFETRHKIHKSSGHVKSVRLSTAGSLSSETRSLVETQTTRIGLSSFTAPETIYKILQTAKTTKHDYIQTTRSTHQHQTRKIKKVKAESCGKVVIAAETPVIAGTVPWRCRSRGFPESCPAKRSTEVKSATFWDTSANSYNAPCAPF